MNENIPDPIRKFLEKINSEPKQAFSPKIARENAEANKSETNLPKIPIELVEDRQLEMKTHNIPVRIYHPKPTCVLPLIFYYHGGGHVIGSIETHDVSCRRIADTCQAVVISVGYRLAPEDPFPAGLNDCQDVFSARAELLDDLAIDKNNIFLAGDSAGGNLALSVSYNAKQSNDHVIKGLMLIYPSVDFTMAHDSITRLGSGYLLEKNDIQHFFDCYLQSISDRKSVSPLYFENLSIMPPVYMAVAEFDPLRDEELEFAKCLQAKHVPIKVEVIPGMIHVFMLLEKYALNEIQRVLNSMKQFIQEYSK